MMSQRCLKLHARVFFSGVLVCINFHDPPPAYRTNGRNLKTDITMDHLISRERVIGGEVGLPTGRRPSDVYVRQDARMIFIGAPVSVFSLLEEIEGSIEENHVGCLTINLRKIYQKNMLNVTFWLHKDVNMVCVLCHEKICLDNVCG